MRATRQRDTDAELKLRSALFRRGLRYRLQQRLIPGMNRRADIVFLRAKVAVFVDGCFWHGCPKHGTSPKSNSAFWQEKIVANQRRDRDTNMKLVQLGWRVVRVWEHEDPDVAAERIQALVETC